MDFLMGELTALNLVVIGITLYGRSYEKYISRFQRDFRRFMGGLIITGLVFLRVIELVPEFEYNKPRGGFTNVSCALQGSIGENKK